MAYRAQISKLDKDAPCWVLLRRSILGFLVWLLRLVSMDQRKTINGKEIPITIKKEKKPEGIPIKRNEVFKNERWFQGRLRVKYMNGGLLVCFNKKKN